LDLEPALEWTNRVDLKTTSGIANSVCGFEATLEKSEFGTSHETAHKNRLQCIANHNGGQEKSVNHHIVLILNFGFGTRL